MHNHAPTDYFNPFSALVAGDFSNLITEPESVFYKDQLVTGFISTKCWPGNEGNVLLIPDEVYENLYDIPDEVLAHLHVVSKKIAIAVRETYGCDGVSLRQHNEPAGNQEVWHYHLHIFPRYKGDELYIRHNEKTDSTSEDRKKYATLLRDYLNKNKS